MDKRILKNLCCLAMTALVSLSGAATADAQLNNMLKKAGEAAKRSTKEKVAEKTYGKTPETAAKSVTQRASAGLSSGKAFYVSLTTGSARGDGSKDAPLKDIQKAIDQASDGATIRVAEGTYLGPLDRGYFEITKYLTIEGGWAPDFSVRNPLKHRTMIQNTAAQSSARGVFNLDVQTNPFSQIRIDGIIFDGGEFNRYCVYDPSNAVTGSPEGCLTGRLVRLDEAPKCPTTEGKPSDQYMLRGTIKGNLVIANCAFINCQNFAVQVQQLKGNVDIYNNIFVANTMAACQIIGNTNEMHNINLNFHHNTVMFTWCRNKLMEDMGYGFRYFSGIGVTDVYNNIFGCSNLAALDLTHFDSSKQKEAERVRHAHDNLFFANKADLEIAGPGGTPIFANAARFDEVEQLQKYENNKEIEDEAFLKAVDEAYLKGFMSLEILASRSYNASSAANQFNRAFGLNQQGTETVRVSM